MRLAVGALIPTNVVFFRSPTELRKWFAKNAATATELGVGFYRKDSGRKSITWSEAVDEALSIGWIDGIRKSLDSMSYTHRFTPRRKRSTWSAVNIGRAQTPGYRKRLVWYVISAKKKESAARVSAS